MSRVKKNLLTAVIFVGLLVFIAISVTNSVFAAQAGDACDPSKTPPSGFTCEIQGVSPSGGYFLKPVATTQTGTSNCSEEKKNFFFFLPPWYEYLTLTHDPYTNTCTVDFDFPEDILAVALAIVDMLLRLAGFVAIISIIIAGVQHIFSGGNPENAAAARRRIYNSLIALGIVSVAAAFVTFIGKTFT